MQSSVSKEGMSTNIVSEEGLKSNTLPEKLRLALHLKKLLQDWITKKPNKSP